MLEKEGITKNITPASGTLLKVVKVSIPAPIGAEKIGRAGPLGDGRDPQIAKIEGGTPRSGEDFNTVTVAPSC